MYADPCEDFGRWHVWRRGIRVNVGDDWAFVARRRSAGIGMAGTALRKQAKQFDSMPRDWRAAGNVVADSSRATAEFSGNRSDRKAAGQLQKLMYTAVSLLCEHLGIPAGSLKGA